MSCGFPVTRPTPLFIDSRATLDLAADPVAFKRTKHILRHAHELRDRVLRRVFAPEYVESASQLADILTKALRVHLHVALLDRLLPVSGPPTPSAATVPVLAMMARVKGGQRAIVLALLLRSLYGHAGLPPARALARWRLPAVTRRLDALAIAFGLRRPTRVTRANLAAAVMLTYSPAAVRRAGRGRFLDLFPGSSITGVNRWLRCLDRLAFVRALQ